MSDSTRKTPHLFATATLGVWARLIREHGGVPPRHWGRLAGILATSVATAPLRVAERLRYDRLVARTAIDHAPVFIQGFARSGTTHLHNLMGQRSGPRLRVHIACDHIALLPDFARVAGADYRQEATCEASGGRRCPRA